jgi:hypothetical protein
MADQIYTVEKAAAQFVGDVGLALTPSPEPLAQGEGRNGNHNGEEQAQAKFQSAVALLRNYPGRTQVFFHLDVTDKEGRPVTVTVRGGEKLGIRPAPELFVGLRSILGVGAVRVTGEGTQIQRAPEPAWKRRQAQAQGAGFRG